jgi:hypothetical protein
MQNKLYKKVADNSVRLISENCKLKLQLKKYEEIIQKYIEADKEQNKEKFKLIAKNTQLELKNNDLRRNNPYLLQEAEIDNNDVKKYIHKYAGKKDKYTSFELLDVLNTALFEIDDLKDELDLKYETQEDYNADIIHDETIEDDYDTM